jgi:hypothetical protein
MTSPERQTPERRRHARTPVGLPVRVHFAGHELPMTAELGDLSSGGCYFRGLSAPLSSKVAFGFVLPGRRVCVAGGRVLRIEGAGFAVAIDRTNQAFRDFLSGISSQSNAQAA